MAYATTAQLCQQFDRRDIAGMCAESNTPVSPSNIEASPIAAAALDRASGIIRSTSAIANKYSDDDLETLARDGDAFLVWLTCAIAVGLLLQRRSVAGNRDTLPVVKEANDWLKQLREGQAIFNVAANRDKGNIQTVTPTVVELSNEGLLSGLAAGKFFPDRYD